MANKTLSRKDREKLAHRNELVQAARQVFVTCGYHGSTIEQIAREADFAVGTVYNFFANKEELFAEVITDMTREVFTALQREVFSKQDPVTAVEALIEFRLRFPQDQSGLFRMLVEAAPSGPETRDGTLPTACQETYREYVESLIRVIKAGIAAGTFRDEDPLCLTLCLEGAFHTFGMRWVLEEPNEPLAERVAKVKRILLGMLHKPESDQRRSTKL